MKRESCVADGILFKIGIHMHYIKKKKRCLFFILPFLTLLEEMLQLRLFCDCHNPRIMLSLFWNQIVPGVI